MLHSEIITKISVRVRRLKNRNYDLCVIVNTFTSKMSSFQNKALETKSQSIYCGRVYHMIDNGDAIVETYEKNINAKLYRFRKKSKPTVQVEHM